ALRLEGLDLWRIGGNRTDTASVVDSSKAASIHIANCRLVLRGAWFFLRTSTVSCLRNCELLGDDGHFQFKCRDHARLSVDNCALAGVGTHIIYDEPWPTDVIIEVTQSTWIAPLSKGPFGLNLREPPRGAKSDLPFGAVTFESS